MTMHDDRESDGYRSLGSYVYTAGEVEAGGHLVGMRVERPLMMPIMASTELWLHLACGAAVADRDAHDRWHDAQDAR